MTVHGTVGSLGGVVSAWVAVELVPEQDTGPKKIQLVEVQHVQEILLSKNHVMTVPAVKVDTVHLFVELNNVLEGLLKTIKTNYDQLF